MVKLLHRSPLRLALLACRFPLGAAAMALTILGVTMTSVGAERPVQADNSVTQAARPGESVPARGVTSEQRETLEARIGTAQAIVDRLEADAKRRGMGSGWRQATLEMLLPLPLEALQQVEQRAFNLDALAHATAEISDDQQLLGDANRDLVYTPITPCRYIDTRNVAGKINGVRGFNLGANGATYGGLAACAPLSVFGVASEDRLAAIAMNVTIVDPSTAPGFVAAKPMAASPTTSLVNWSQAGPTVQVANQGIISILQDNAAADEFVLQSSAPVHVIVDVFGAFVSGPGHTLISATGGGPNPSATLQFFGAPVAVVVDNPAQRILVIAFNAFGTLGSSAGALNLFICYQALPPPSPLMSAGNGIIGLQLPASTKATQGLTKVLQLSPGSYVVGMCGTGGAGWNNNDWGTTSAFVF